MAPVLHRLPDNSYSVTQPWQGDSALIYTVYPTAGNTKRMIADKSTQTYAQHSRW